MLSLPKNHEEGLKSANLVAAVTPVLDEVRLVRVHGKLRIKASEDLILHVFLAYALSFEVMDKSVFIMYID